MSHSLDEVAECLRRCGFQVDEETLETERCVCAEAVFEMSPRGCLGCRCSAEVSVESYTEVSVESYTDEKMIVEVFVGRDLTDFGMVSIFRGNRALSRIREGILAGLSRLDLFREAMGFEFLAPWSYESTVEKLRGKCGLEIPRPPDAHETDSTISELTETDSIFSEIGSFLIGLGFVRNGFANGRLTFRKDFVATGIRCDGCRYLLVLELDICQDISGNTRFLAGKPGGGLFEIRKRISGGRWTQESLLHAIGNGLSDLLMFADDIHLYVEDKESIAEMIGAIGERWRTYGFR